jgi:hypothetical protein
MPRYLIPPYVQYSTNRARLRYAGQPLSVPAAARARETRKAQRGEFRVNLTGRDYLDVTLEAPFQILETLAEDGTKYGKQISPRYEMVNGYPPRVHYQDAFEVVPDVSRADHPVLVARAPVRHAMAVEFSGSSTPAYRVMGRTMDFLAQRFTPELARYLRKSR